MRTISSLLLLALLLPACTVKTIRTTRQAAPDMRPLPEAFDCLRERRLALVVAHRGQMEPKSPENSLESFRNTSERGPILIEVDIARSSDGVLMLMHDTMLDRTTTGSGRMGGKTYRQLRELQLKNGEGDILDERIPTLEEALVLAKRRGSVLQLKLRPGASLTAVVDQVRQAGMERQVILAAPSLAEARLATKIAPEMMLSASGTTAAENRALLKLAGPRMIGFIGAREPDPQLVARMDAARVEAAIATSGPPGERLDDRYLADGNGSEYGDLAARGAALIASDQAVEAWRALKRADRDGTICLMGEPK